MIGDLPNGLKANPKPDELKTKQLQAVRQAEAARKQEAEPDKTVAPVDKVSASREISEELNGPYEQQEHQGLNALLANFGVQAPKKLEANDKVNEVGKCSELHKVKENPDKKAQVREPKEDDKRSVDKAKDPKAADRMGNLKVSSKKEAQGVKDKPQLPSSENQPNHQRIGSKGAPKTDAPRPVGAAETLKRAKPDPKVGLRQLPQMRNNGADKTDFSEEIKQALAAQKQAVA